jgi:hypothetical protein
MGKTIAVALAKVAFKKGKERIPLVEIIENKGKIMASELELNMGIKDPIASRLLLYLINALLKN